MNNYSITGYDSGWGERKLADMDEFLKLDTRAGKIREDSNPKVIQA